MNRERTIRRRDFLKAAGGGAVGAVAFTGLLDHWAHAAEPAALDIRVLATIGSQITN